MGIEPRIAFEVGDPGTAARLAAQGLGVALLPESVASTYPDGLRLIPLTQPKLRGQIALAWRSDQSASLAAAGFISHARRQFAAVKPQYSVGRAGIVGGLR